MIIEGAAYISVVNLYNHDGSKITQIDFWSLNYIKLHSTNELTEEEAYEMLDPEAVKRIDKEDIVKAPCHCIII